MVDLQHASLTGASLHEPKGVSAAPANRVYVSNGLGSGSWIQVPSAALSDTTQSFNSALLHVQDSKSSGTAGAGIARNNWVTRELNTVALNEISGASLNSNNIELPTGTYFIMGSASIQMSSTGGSPARARNRIFNETTGNTIALGTPLYVGGESFSILTGTSTFSGRFTLIAPASITLQSFVNSSTGSPTGGTAVTTGINEVYADILIWKIA